ncbi:hypothetical protein EBA01_13015 [Xanthomonas oryzae pv. oryzae]|nr:hypothetical protein C0L89_13010 [Xanthomonas oryzae pv. oryzae]AVU03188.1 hypothetical protein C0L90_13210 [Xanthomonas oryzae pv. oryzae]QBI12749.1 hypothetical protein EYR02_13060 [Xanthomonas oryzae pv. oryzae]QBI16403.1 hypothetical protein EYR03_13490 [Xanthomonas oryzae pv. oryzae]QBN24705.1 hypothetical protein EBA00_09375 [Xanthomonas oryzae pv. oryzae]
MPAPQRSPTKTAARISRTASGRLYDVFELQRDSDGSKRLIEHEAGCIAPRDCPRSATLKGRADRCWERPRAGNSLPGNAVLPAGALAVCEASAISMCAVLCPLLPFILKACNKCIEYDKTARRLVGISTAFKRRCKNSHPHRFFLSVYG